MYFEENVQKRILNYVLSGLSSGSEDDGFCNDLGMIFEEGKIVEQDLGKQRSGIRKQVFQSKFMKYFPFFTINELHA